MPASSVCVPATLLLQLVLLLLLLLLQLAPLIGC
jgi:hypothetical protein